MGFITIEVALFASQLLATVMIMVLDKEDYYTHKRKQIDRYTEREAGRKIQRQKLR